MGSCGEPAPPPAILSGRCDNPRVLFSQWSWEGIADGSITATFRRWKRRQASTGGVYRTPVGRIEALSVDVVAEDEVTDADARASGYPSSAALLDDLRGTPDLPIYRIRFRLVAGPDPRAVLAADEALTDDDRAELDRRLDRLDKASKHGPWTRQALELIGQRPAVRAGDLADEVGRERLDFKVDVRKLKNLGLTISLGVGYRLSPRGEAYLSGRSGGD
jgi:hypothetical protein